MGHERSSRVGAHLRVVDVGSVVDDALLILVRAFHASSAKDTPFSTPLTVPTETPTADAISRIDCPLSRPGQDRGPLVLVDHPRPAADLATGACCVQPVLGLAHDVAPAVLGQRERHICSW